MFPEQFGNPGNEVVVKKHFSYFQIAHKTNYSIPPPPRKKIKYPLHCTSNFFWEVKAKKAILRHFWGGGGGRGAGGGGEQGVLLKVIKNEYFLEETGCGKRTPR